MFFRKKKPDSSLETSAEAARADGTGRGNQRNHYRVRSRGPQRVRVTLERESAAPITGECVDLSIGGAWVEFHDAHEPKLSNGDLCSLRIRADSHTEAIQATSRVVTVLPLDHGSVRVGFQFPNRIELYAQLDEFYSRCFNRRRHVRAVPEYDVRIPVQLSWPGGSLHAVAHDFSEGGLGIIVPLTKSKALIKVKEIELAFRLPKERTDIVCRAAIKSRSDFANTCLIGIEFSPGGGIDDHLVALRRCIDKRLVAFEALNARLGKAGLTKRAS